MQPAVQKRQNPSGLNPSPLNPNWARLQQKLKIHGNKSSHISNNLRGQRSNLGKCVETPDTELDNAQINLLNPTNDDHSVTDVIAIDCEMVGVNEANKSALGRVALVNHWRNVLYDEFVRPMDHIVDFRTHVSGIRPRDMKKAKPFLVVQHEVAELMKGRILVGHSLRNDLKVLLLTHPKNDMRDTLEYKPFRKTRKLRALRHLAAEYLGIEIQTGEHCPVEDARAAMMLYEKHKKEWEKSAKHEAKLKLLQNKRKNKTKRKLEHVANARR